MKNTLFVLMLTSLSGFAFADAAGGNGCGWGNLLFEGQTGKVPHVIGITTNGTSGNNTFGVTSGTNGCSSKAVIGYGGKSMVDLSALMDEFSEDVARGEGEVITAVAISMGVEKSDRAIFKATLQENFTAIFPGADVTAEEVMLNIREVMGQNHQLAKYAS